MDAAAGTVWIGSVVFLAGAAIAVPQVFTEPDRERRLALLEAGRSRWRAGQPLYAAGAVVVALGVGRLAGSAGPGAGRAALWASSVLLLAGAACWCWSVYQRARWIRRFALGELPGGPFTAYVLLTLVGLGLLGLGLLASGSSAWSGWTTLAGAAAFLEAYARYGDIPPFVFYLLLPVVSLGWA